MEMDDGHGSQLRLGAKTTTPMDTTDEDDVTGSMSHTLMEGANENHGAPDGGGRGKHMRGADTNQGAANGGGPAVAPGARNGGGDTNQGATNGRSPAVAPGAKNGGGSTPMDVDNGKSDHKSTSNNTKGTIRAYFSNMHYKGAKPTKPYHGEDKYGGGSKHTTNSLKTTMKKVHKSRKKTGIISTRGAKSRIERELMKKKQGSDSSQMVIGRYFPRKEGIIGPGLSQYGRIPLGEIKKTFINQ